MIFKKINEVIKFNSTLMKAKLITTEGSVPRDKGTLMLISEKYIFGSIGGGQLEYNIINKSLIFLKNNKFKEEIINIPLGPSIGQCCGGYVQVKITKHKDGKNSIQNENIINKNEESLYIFGAGHVGSELSLRSIDLDFKVNLIDSREEYLKVQENKKITNIYAKLPWLLVKNLKKNSFIIVLTHSHDFDFKIINEVLKFNNFNFLGLIGSNTKKKRFENRLLKLGHKKSVIGKIECPVGLKSITSKKPAEIAISIIARLLEYRSNLSANVINHENILSKVNEKQ